MHDYLEIVTIAPMGDETAEVLRVVTLMAQRFSSRVHFVHHEHMAPTNIGYSAETSADIQRLRRELEHFKADEADRIGKVNQAIDAWRLETGLEADLTVKEYAPEPAIWSLMLTSDIAVLPRPRAMRHPDVEAILLEVGRPALLALGHAHERLGERIAVFWRCTPPTSHAVAAAMPFLRDAKAVSLVCVGEDDDDPSVERAKQWLERHAVNVEVQRPLVVEGSSVGATLVGAAGEFDADMIVMGAYGHSRLREWVLGSVTRYVLQNAERPVFTCH